MTAFAAVCILLIFWIIDRYERKKKVRMMQLNESCRTTAPPHPVNATLFKIQAYLNRTTSMEELYKYRAIAEHDHADPAVIQMIDDRILYVSTH